MKSRYFLLGSFLLGLLFFSSCKESREEQIARMVEEWSGKEIRFPEKPVFTIQCTDTVGAPAVGAPYKVLVYVDSVGCMGCRLQLPKWKELMATTDSLAPGKVAFHFYLYPKDLNEMRYVLRRDAFRHPVCIDTADSLNALNHFPSEDTFQTFLLGADNRVLAIGNPVHNPKVKDLYLSLVTGRKQAAPSATTTVSLDRAVVELGTFSWSEVKTDSLFITNTGDRPFVIHDVVTNCGCLQAKFSKEPVRPGERMKLDVIYRADNPGTVDKLLQIYGNVEGEKLDVRVKGEARKE